MKPCRNTKLKEYIGISFLGILDGFCLKSRCHLEALMPGLASVTEASARREVLFFLFLGRQKIKRGRERDTQDVVYK